MPGDRDVLSDQGASAAIAHALRHWAHDCRRTGYGVIECGGCQQELNAFGNRDGSGLAEDLRVALSAAGWLLVPASELADAKEENERLRAAALVVVHRYRLIGERRWPRGLVELRDLLAGTPLPSDDKQPAPPEGLSVGRAQECEHCYQDGRCLSEPCPRPPKYPRGYDEDADREWDEWEALKATLPSPRQEDTKGADHA